MMYMSCTGDGVSVQMSAAIQSIASVQQQQQQQQPGRPTQQVQPVSSHFEEATGKLIALIYQGRSINKLQNSVILLVLLYKKSEIYIL